MAPRADVAIIGGGIVGLAAAVRNFGMVWPIGQPSGAMRQLALRSRELWLELATAAEIWCNPYGSLHLAHHPDEWTVIQEFAARADGSQCQAIGPEEVRRRGPAVKARGLLGGLWSPLELCVDPRQALPRLAALHLCKLLDDRDPHTEEPSVDRRVTRRRFSARA